jgi:hypothetical protein
VLKVIPRPLRATIVGLSFLIGTGSVASAASLPSFTALSAPLPAETPHRACFEAAALRYELPVGLLVAVAKVESAFNPRAVSHKNAVGVMQILWPGTAAHLGITRRTDLFVPCISIDAGARYLRELLGQFQVGELALAAYNMGPSRIRSSRVEDLPRAGKEYVELVAGAAHRLLNGRHVNARVSTTGINHLTFRLPSADRARAVVAALKVRDAQLETSIREVDGVWLLTVVRR